MFIRVVLVLVLLALVFGGVAVATEVDARDDDAISDLDVVEEVADSNAHHGHHHHPRHHHHHHTCAT
jgi:uncharacterized membrane protein